MLSAVLDGLNCIYFHVYTVYYTIHYYVRFSKVKKCLVVEQFVPVLLLTYVTLQARKSTVVMKLRKLCTPSAVFKAETLLKTFGGMLIFHLQSESYISLSCVLIKYLYKKLISLNQF